jgi:NADPH2:quinone reductase
VSSAAEAQLARGAAEVIDYEREDFAARVRELTHGDGVPVVYDSLGADFPASLDARRLIATSRRARRPARACFCRQLGLTVA